MAVSSDNTRITITITKEIKKELSSLAKNKKCSVSKLCSNIIMNYTKQKSEVII